MRKSFFYLIFLLLSFSSLAQVTISPAFPSQNDSITVTYDATNGNAALVNLGPPIVYMHAGVITDKSPTNISWRHVQGDWGKADNKVVMTYLGNNIYQKKYHIRDFYGVPTDEQILRLAFVFRNVDGSKVGRAKDGGDIFIDINQSGFALKVLAPLQREQIVSIGEFIDISALTSEKCDINIYLNESLLKQVSNDSTISDLYEVKNGGNNVLQFEAILGSDTARDTFYFVVNPNRPLVNPDKQLDDGVEFLTSTLTRFTLYAPQKDFVYLIGDFNNWQLDTTYLMHKTTDGNRFWLDVPNLKAGEEYAYQYYIDGKINVADPFSTKILDWWNDGYILESTYPNLKKFPTNKTIENVSVFTAYPTPYKWKIENFTPPAKSDLIIYELLIRDFIDAHDYKTLIDTLDYLSNLGVNAIELMPVAEFEGNVSWGYNVSFHMALDKYYGTPDNFKKFIDECHARGMAVLLDVVYNHAFSQSPLCKMYWDNTKFEPTSNNPYLNVTARHPFNVGYDINHESSATKYWLDRINRYWIEEFNIDGFRFDLSKGFTQKNSGSDVGAWGSYDASRISLLKRMSDKIRMVDNDAILILEHFADNSEEKELGNYGFLMWGNLNHDFTEAAMGYPADIGWASYKNRGQSKADWVVYMESHDEERMLYKTTNFGKVDGSYNIKNTAIGLERAALSACFLMGIPGPKMIWQFGELGYDVSIDFNGRIGPKPIRWKDFEDPARKDLYEVYAELNHLKKTYSAFATNDFQINVSGFGKTIQLNDDNMDVVIMGNFDSKLIDVEATFKNNGFWYEYFTGDSIEITKSKTKLALIEGEYRIYTSKKINRVYPDKVGLKPSISLSKGLKAYPNPSNNQFHLVNQNDASFTGSIEIVDLSGKLMYSKNNTYVDGFQSIEISADLTPGIYLIRLINSNGTQQTIRHSVL